MARGITCLMSWRGNIIIQNNQIRWDFSVLKKLIRVAILGRRAGHMSNNTIYFTRNKSGPVLRIDTVLAKPYFPRLLFAVDAPVLTDQWSPLVVVKWGWGSPCGVEIAGQGALLVVKFSSREVAVELGFVAPLDSGGGSRGSPRGCMCLTLHGNKCFCAS